MCFAHPFVATYKSGERDRFRSGKGGVPSGAVLHRLDGFSVGILVFVRRPLLDELFASLWVLALAQLLEVLGGNRPGESEARGQPALPFSVDYPSLRPVILFFGGELLSVVALRLACGKWLGDR